MQAHEDGKKKGKKGSGGMIKKELVEETNLKTADSVPPSQNLSFFSTKQRNSRIGASKQHQFHPEFEFPKKHLLRETSNHYSPQDRLFPPFFHRRKY